MVMSKIKLRFRKLPTKEQRPKPFDVEKLKLTDGRQKFQLELVNRFEGLDLITDSVEYHWSVFKDGVTSAAEESIGRRRGTKSEEWLSDDAWRLIGDRKAQKSIMISNGDDESKAEYRRRDKLVKQQCKRDKLAWYEKQARDAEGAATKNDSKKLYSIMRSYLLAMPTTKRLFQLKTKTGQS